MHVSTCTRAHPWNQRFRVLNGKRVTLLVGGERASRQSNGRAQDVPVDHCSCFIWCFVPEPRNVESYMLELEHWGTRRRATKASQKTKRHRFVTCQPPHTIVLYSFSNNIYFYVLTKKLLPPITNINNFRHGRDLRMVNVTARGQLGQAEFELM